MMAVIGAVVVMKDFVLSVVFLPNVLDVWVKGGIAGLMTVVLVVCGREVGQRGVLENRCSEPLEAKKLPSSSES